MECFKIIESKEKNNNRKKTEAKKFFFENYSKDVKINISATAKSLGVSRLTIYRWIKEIKK